MKDKIIELRNLGFSYNEISKKLNCSKSTISYHCSKLNFNSDVKIKNLKIKNKKQEKEKSFLLENVDVNKIIELRNSKKTYKEIIELTGLSKHTISKICRDFNLVKNRKHGQISPQKIEDIKKLYEELKSTRKVSTILNVSRSTIMKYVNVRPKLTEEELRLHKSDNVVQWRRRVKIKLAEYKGGKCEKCGYNKCIDALEFHHKDPKEKDFNISRKSWSFERLKKEVEKCILVCSNCHKEIHFELKIPR